VEKGVTIVPARGHTMGHVAVRVESGGQSALFSGDALHTPLQIVYPQCPTYACEDKPQTVATHLAVLAECAEHRRFLVPTHFPEPYAAVCVHEHAGRFLFTDLLGTMPKGLAGQ
jgi:glyoxylase-like metal-dependent hydrolase (beta-lactamase superfamily II)